MCECVRVWRLLNRNHYWWYTVYPKKYAHGFVVLCFVVVMQSFIMNSHEVFIHIHQGCFAGTGAIVRLPQCQWSKPDGYGKISQCITTTKHSKSKTVCIFLGIYCSLSDRCYSILEVIDQMHWVKVLFRGPKLFKKKRGTISRIIVHTWYLYAPMNMLAIRLWMDGLNLNVIFMYSPIWFCHTAAIASTWQPVQNLSTALPARGCHALQRVIGWALSCTCIVTSWSQRLQPKRGGVADWRGLTCHSYGRKFAI